MIQILKTSKSFGSALRISATEATSTYEMKPIQSFILLCTTSPPSLSAPPRAHASELDSNAQTRTTRPKTS